MSLRTKSTRTMATSFTSAILSLLCIPLLLILGLLLFLMFGFALILFSIVKLTVELYYKGKLQISTGFDSYFFSDNNDNKMIICAILDGHYNVSGIEDWKKFVMTARNINGRLIAANLQTLTEKKLGFVFRKKDPNFNINDHVKEIPRILKSKSELKEIVSEEIQREWRKNKPKWSVAIYKITDCSKTGENISKKSLVVFSMCHSLTDAFSFILFNYEFAKSINKNMKDMKKLKFKLTNNFPAVIYNTFFFFPLFIMKIFFKPDNKFFKSNEVSKQGMMSFLDSLTSDRVKASAKATRTSDFIIYISCFAAPAHKYIKVSGCNSFGDMSTAFPVSFQKASDPLTLSNKLFLMPMWLPVGEMKVLDRLQEIKRRTDEIKNSPLPIVVKIFNDLLSMCPNFVYKSINAYLSPGLTMSISPDFKEDKQFMCGQEFTQVFAGLTMHRNSGIVVIVYLQKRAFIALTVNRKVFKSQEDADRFLKYFEEEFQSLEEIVNEEIKKLE